MSYTEEIHCARCGRVIGVTRITIGFGSEDDYETLMFPHDCPVKKESHEVRVTRSLESPSVQELYDELKDIPH